MDNVVKKIFVAIVLLSLILLTSCLGNQQINKKEIGNTVDKMMGYIIDENKTDLLRFFSSDIRDNREEETLKEMEKAFEFINGNIISYEYAGICGEEEHKDKGKIEFFLCYPEFRNVTTDTGYKYTIEFTYHYIYSKKPEREGICKILIFNQENHESKIAIGLTYYRNE